MPRAINFAVQNTFKRGLITEATGLSFPEDACTSASNCVFSRLGEVTRRLGIDFETDASYRTIDRASKAISTFFWKDVNGNGLVNLFVTQVGSTLYFWDASTVTTAFPLSNHQVTNTVDLTTYLPLGSGNSPSALECNYFYGFGKLFVVHPYLDPFYVTYSAGNFTVVAIDIKIRDFEGIDEPGVADNLRPTSLSTNHNYNLFNQGWTNPPAWTASSTTSNNTNTGSHTWTVATGLTISGGTTVSVVGYIPSGVGGGPYYNQEAGTVTSYNSGTGALVLNITSSVVTGQTSTSWTFSSISSGNLTTWNSALANYPSNADVWWRFKNSSGTFAPSTTAANISLDLAPAPKGHYLLSAFSQNRNTAAGLTGITDVTSNYIRPITGCWYAGRAFYSGVSYEGFNNKIYFTQIVERVNQLERCYQANDPTSEEFFDLLPSDGGVIVIKEAETIHKLWPLQEALIVFASNGIWLISGSSGIGFSAVDYTITKISSISTLSNTSFVDVEGMPVWWNTEGIYTMQMAENKRVGQSGMAPQSITWGTIQSFYEDIPAVSKKFARGYYNRTSFIIQWLYRSTAQTTTTNTYEFDSILCYNTQTGAFYTYSIAGTPKISGMFAVDNHGGLTTSDTLIEPTFKYFTSYAVAGPTYRFTFAEEIDTDYKDWTTYDSTGVDYDSYFVTGYLVRGGGIRKFQENYVNVFSNNEETTSYKIRAQWNYANTSTTGKWSTAQTFTNVAEGYDVKPNKIKLRGHGIACQFKIYNNSNNPFNIIGWAMFETGNQRT